MMAPTYLKFVVAIIMPLLSSSSTSCLLEDRDGENRRHSKRSVLLQKVRSVGSQQDIAGRSIANKLGPCRDCEIRAGYKRLVGEFHEPLAFTGNIMELLQNPKCKNFYNTAGDWLTTIRKPSKTIIDHSSRLFRPASEVEPFTNVSEEPSLPETPFQRMVTYEDVAFPLKFYSDNVTGTTGDAEMFAKENYCEMFAIRTPQRPVKVVTWNQTASNKTYMMPAIWKVASTSISKMLGESLNQHLIGNVRGCHGSFKDFTPANPLPQSERHTTFHQDAVDAEVKAALVRSPLDRFLASIYEHGVWKSCTVNGTDGQVCDEQVEPARVMARRLVREFPHGYRSCAHPSQMYFLSATDVYGKPFQWDQVMRLEDHEHSFAELQKMIGLAELSENPSGDKEIKSKYFKAVFTDLETVCAVCKVYAQDFECLGYAKPEQCTKDECKKVGIDLP